MLTLIVADSHCGLTHPSQVSLSGKRTGQWEEQFASVDSNSRLNSNLPLSGHHINGHCIPTPLSPILPRKFLSRNFFRTNFRPHTVLMSLQNITQILQFEIPLMCFINTTSETSVTLSLLLCDLKIMRATVNVKKPSENYWLPQSKRFHWNHVSVGGLLVVRTFAGTWSVNSEQNGETRTPYW